MRAHYAQISSFRIFPEAASTVAPHVDAIMWVLFGTSGFVFLGVSFTILYFVVRYHHTRMAVRTLTKRQRHMMEYSWTLIPLLLFLTVYTWAAYQYFEEHEPPPDSEEIFVVAKRWMWKFQHANGIRELNELHIPVGRPIKLVMASQDVIHSFFVPEFRIKQDVVPGRYDYTWFQAISKGHFHLLCTQFCGVAHSDMVGEIIAMDPADYAHWVQSQLLPGAGRSPVTLASQGRQLFTRYGCASCHDTDGRVAPDLHGLFMSRVGLENGQTAVADESYLRESILNPSARIVMGYPDIMPSYQGQASEEDVMALIAYIKSLKSPGRPEP